jgi:hypothetical protein
MSDYLAIYLEIDFDLRRPSVFVPIRLFAESTHRLSQDIQLGQFFTTLDQANEALRRILAARQPQAVVLLESTLPAQQVILKRFANLHHMRRMIHELGQAFAPPSAPVVQSSPQVDNFRIFYGMKNLNTPYPDPFVEARNFTSDFGMLDWDGPRLQKRAAFFGNGFFFALVFDRPGSRQAFSIAKTP